MAKASKKSPEEKLRVVLSVLRGEQSAVDAGRRAGVSEQTVHNWKKLFLDSGRDGLAQEYASKSRNASSTSSNRLSAQKLKSAFQEAGASSRRRR